MLKPLYSEGFKKQYKKLPPILQNKFLKQLNFLLKNPHHPSLHTKRVSGTEKFEARVDYHNRLTFLVVQNEIWFLSIGPHDEGLGKK